MAAALPGQLHPIHRMIPAPTTIEQLEDVVVSYSTAEDLMFLLKQIRGNDPTVQQIDLERKRLPAAYLKALFSALASSKYVTRLRLTKTGVTDQVAGAVADFLRYNTSVTDLDLTKNGLTDEGCMLLAAALTTDASKSNSSLRRLNLEGNPISDVGIRALCEALPGTGIHVLKLGKLPAGIGDAGVQAIATLLRLQDCPLHKLDLRSCGLGNTGASALAKALETNTSLLSLCLGRNSIGNAAVEDFAAALQHNTVMQTLDLQYNEFTDAGAVAFVQCLETSNDSFQKLKLRYCDAVSESMKEKLLDLLLVNSHGPDLAQKTKKALRGLLLEESFRKSIWSDESSSSLYSESSTSCNFDGGSDGIVREVPPAPVSVCNTVPEDCVICFDVPAGCALLPCKHRNCCTSCAKQLKTCHMCRETIVKIFPMGGKDAETRRPIHLQREESVNFAPTRSS